MDNELKINDILKHYIDPELQAFLTEEIDAEIINDLKQFKFKEIVNDLKRMQSNLPE